MIDKKDKYRLRSLANPMKSIVIIGHEGLSENIIDAINDAIKTHELIKISILKTYVGLSTKEMAELICSMINAELIYTCGRVMTIYKKNKDINRYGIK
ncbi:MAG: YhbY family RNA-binding protein [Erysipelotrichaceae bacterium]|nr:YhbY family RNA-binding protein [Erysipelotrichaceae bacterium]